MKTLFTNFYCVFEKKKDPILNKLRMKKLFFTEGCEYLKMDSLEYELSGLYYYSIGIDALLLRLRLWPSRDKREREKTWKRGVRTGTAHHTL